MADSLSSDMGSDLRSETHLSPVSEGPLANGAQRLTTAALEGSAVLIVPEKLSGDGSNYRQWAQSIRLAIDGRGRLGYITGTTAAPPQTDMKAYQTWQSENSMVTSWLINAMAPGIRKSFMFLPSAHDIWEAVKEAYGDGATVPLIFDLQQQVWDLKQNSLSLSDYYLAKSALWQEIDLVNDDQHECCTSHTARHLKRLE